MTIKELKTIAQRLEESGLTHEEARETVGRLNREKNEKALADILAGNIPKELNPGFTTKAEIIPADIIPTAPDIIPTVTGEIVDSSELLPPDFSETIRGWLVDLAELHNIDIEKCSNIQWHSLCMDIGERIQKSGILRDREAEKRKGGMIYNPNVLLALVPIWEKITGYYKHIPLTVDYIAFTGVHRNYFYDYDKRGLTASRVRLAEKVRAIEEGALSVALTDSRENPTGRIYYTKARLGWRETTEIIHTSAKETQQAASLPVFDGVGGLLDG